MMCAAWCWLLCVPSNDGADAAAGGGGGGAASLDLTNRRRAAAEKKRGELPKINATSGWILQKGDQKAFGF